MAAADQDRAIAFAELSEALRAAHSYEVPEIMALPVLEGSPAYLAWLTAETNA